VVDLSEEVRAGRDEKAPRHGVRAPCRDLTAGRKRLPWARSEHHRVPALVKGGGVAGAVRRPRPVGGGAC